MFHIAAGVALGIVAAVYLINWLGRVAEWREERRERRAYRKITRAYEKAAREAAQEAESRARCEAEHQAWLAKMSKPVTQNNVLHADIVFWSIIAFMLFVATMNGLGYH